MDPNTYALTVQLDIEDSKVFRSLDNLSIAMTDLESDISNAAKNALASLNNVASTLETSLGQTVEHARAIDDIAIKLGKDFNKVSKVFLNIDTTNDKLVNKFDEIRDYLEDRLRIEKKLEKLSIDQQKRADLFVKTIENTIASISRKNLGHQQQLDLLNQEAEAARQGANNIKDQSKAVDETTVSFSRIINAVRSAINYLLGFTDLQEQFVTLNNRAYASMEELASRVRKLASGYSILEKESLEAMKALIEVRTPVENLDRLALTVGKLTRLTGVSAIGIAEYTKRLRGVGLDAASTEEHLAQLADMQRKYGVSVEQMRKSLGDTSVSLTAMETLFEDGGQGFDRLRIQMRGIAEQYGATGDAAASVMAKMANSFVYQQMVASETGLQGINTVEDYGKAMAGLGDRIDDIIKREITAGATRSEALFNAQVYGERVMKLSAQEIDAVRKIAKARREAAAAGKDMDWAAIAEDAQKKMNEQLTDTQRFSREVKLLGNEFRQVIAPIVELTAIAILPLVKALRWLVGWIAWAITGIKSFLDWLANTVPILGPIVRWVVALGVAFLVFKYIIPFVGSLFSGLFSYVASFVPAVIGWMGSLANAFASVLTSIVDAIGTAFQAMMTGIANGLRALLSAVSGSIGSLLALGLALIMVAAAAWIFAQAVKIIAEVGWAAVPAMIGLVAIIGLLGLVLVELAYLAVPVIPAILAISAALLIVGVAALAVGYAIKLISEAFSIFVDAITKLSAGVLINFADALLASSWKITMAVMILSPVMVLLPIIATMLLVSGMILMAASIPFVISASLIGLGATALGYGIKNLSAGARGFKDIDFITIAGQLLVGGLLLLAAGVPFIIGATLVGIGALLFGYGLQSLGPGVKAFQNTNFVTIAAQLLAGGLLLLVAGGPFVIGATLVGIGALLLGYGLQSLGPGTKALAGVDFVTIAGQLLVGGLLLLAAGGPFIIGATLVGIGALLLGYGLQSLGAGAERLKDIDFVTIAAQLLVGGLLLLVAGGPFVIGATLVGIGALILGSGLLSLGAGAERLKDIDFAAMAAQLMVGGVWLALGAAFFVVGATAVGLASVILGIGLLVLGAGASLLSKIDFKVLGEKLITGSYYLLGASMNLLGVGIMMLLVSPVLIAGLVGLLMSGLLFISVSAVLAIGSSLFANAMESLQRGFNILIGVIEPFKKAAFDLLVVTGVLLPATTAILLSGVYILIGAMLLGTGSVALGVSVAALAVVAAGMWFASIAIRSGAVKLETAIAPLLRTLSSITLAIASLNIATTNLNAQAAQFQQTFGGIAININSFTSSLQAPVEQLTTIMGQMADVLTSFGPIGETLEADLDNLITIVDSYAAKLEGVSERIQTAIATKAIPAMRAAEEAGIEEAIKAESISAIEMIPPEKDDNADKTNELLQQQLEVLNKLVEGVDRIGAGSGTEVAQILEMLQTFLPGIVAKEEGLSTQMNDWMR